MIIRMKLVPDGEPNAEGFWLRRRVPSWIIEDRMTPTKTYNLWALLDRRAPKGFHCVQYWVPAKRRGF